MSPHRVHRALRLEELEPRIAPGVAIAYVDDDYTPDTPGWGVDHFALIQEGINAANTGGAVNVAAGVYSETVTLNKSATVTLSGAETVGSFLLSGGTVSASSCNLTITGAYSEGGGVFVSSPTQGTFSVGGSFTLSGGTFSHFTGAGTSGNPYMIYDVYGLQAMQLGLTKQYKLANSIDASSTVNWNSGAGFAPVGSNMGWFTGSLDGDGKTITSIYINRPGTNYVGGPFGYIGIGGSATNLGIVGGTVRGSQDVGGLVGYMAGATVSNSYVTGGVTGGSVVGGLAGYASSSVITNSTASGAAVAGTQVGGLVGYLYAATLSNSHASGAVGVTSGSGTDAGGLAGDVSGGVVSSCYATGAVTGGSYIGGLLGYLGSGTLSNSYATGAVTGSSGGTYVGGLVGYLSYGTVSNCYAAGGVTGGTYVGGLAGLFSGGSVSNSYAAGSVRGTSNEVGGLVGYNDGTVSNCHATGSVTGSSNRVGGLVGYMYSGKIFTSYATGAVSGGSYVGGIVGYNFAGTVSTSYATGGVTGGSLVGGLAGGMNGGTIYNSYATGGVISSSNYAGGLVGYSLTSGIANSYATGGATGSSLVGGLVGQLWGGTVSNSYATGAVSGGSGVGGLVGSSASNAIVSTSYWDTETTGQTASAGGTGKTTAEMKQRATFVGWDFTNTWAIMENVTYPQLNWALARLPLSDGVVRSFNDADGTLVTVGYTGSGSGYFNLLNGSTTGAPIHQMFLSDTMPDTTLSITASGGTVPGTTFDVMTSGAGMGSISLPDIGNGATVSVPGNLDGFTAGNIGDDFTMTVTGGIGTVAVNSIGDRAGVTAGGSVGTIQVETSTGANGSFWVYGSLDRFEASTLGDANMAAVAMDGGTFGAFVADVVKSGSSVGSVYGLGTFGAAEVGDGVLVCAGPLGDFDVPIIGDDFVLWYTQNGTLGSFRANTIGNNMRIIWGLDIESISVEGDIGAEGQILVWEGGVHNFSAGSLGDGFNMVGYGTSGTGTFSAESVGNRSTLWWGHAMSSLAVEGDIGDLVRVGVGGSLGAFTAGNIGAGFSMNVAGATGTFTANDIGDWAAVTGESMNDFHASTIGGNFRLTGNSPGTLASLRANSIGSDLNIQWSGDIGNISVTSGIGTGPTICVGGSLGTVGVGSGSMVHATITAGQGIGAIVLSNGGIQGIIVANGTAGIGSISVTGGSADVDITTPSGKVGSLTVTGASSAGQHLSGSLNVLGVDTLLTTWAGLQNLLLMAGTVGTMEVDGSVTGNSTIRVTSTTGNPVSTILIKGDLASTADYAIVVDGALTAASEIEITGTAATGGFGLGKNLIKIGELDGDLLVGTNASAGIGVFGDVIVADSFHSTGRLVAAARNALATFYTDLLDPTTMTYQIIGSDAGHDWEILFGFNELWA